jgi:hypothetical protein
LLFDDFVVKLILIMTDVAAPTYPEFLAADAEYFGHLNSASRLDPIGWDVGTVALKLQICEPVAVDELVGLAETARTVITDGEPDAVIAAYRDLDKIFGSFARTKSREVPEAIQEVFAGTDLPHPRPRANAYEYNFGSDPSNPNRLYTGQQREANLMRIVRTSVTAAHLAVEHLLNARYQLRTEGVATDQLAAAHEQINLMRQQMIAAYRTVTPEFFTLAMTRRWREVDINGKQTQGPNPSHTAWLLVDRFVAGTFDELTAEPHMAEAYAIRRSSLPGHMNALLDTADAAQDDETILQLAHTPEDIELARDILAIIRKAKRAHKSYADKGLVSKGGTLTPGRPDVLTDNINHYRQAEAAV